MRYGHNAMAPIDATSLYRANSTLDCRSVTTPADQHKTEVNRFLLDHTNKIHFSQACLHGKKFRIGKLYLLLYIITVLQTNYIANSAGVATHMGLFKIILNDLYGLCLVN